MSFDLCACFQPLMLLKPSNSIWWAESSNLLIQSKTWFFSEDDVANDFVCIRVLLNGKHPVFLLIHFLRGVVPTNISALHVANLIVGSKQLDCWFSQDCVFFQTMRFPTTLWLQVLYNMERVMTFGYSNIHSTTDILPDVPQQPSCWFIRKRGFHGWWWWNLTVGSKQLDCWFSQERVFSQTMRYPTTLQLQVT